jgi:gamma-glutamylputrescine oxidase
MSQNQVLNHSYWELNHYFKTFDLIIVGSGIVGLSAAISYKEKHKKATVLILEKGILPDGASTKNAGFACFGSPGELLDDLSRIHEKIVWETVALRWQGLQLLRNRLGDRNIDFRNYGGYELFTDQAPFLQCCEKIDYLNQKISEILPVKNCFNIAKDKKFRFRNVAGMFINRSEGQLDTGKMMEKLLLLARRKGVEILNNIRISNISEDTEVVQLLSTCGIFKSRQVLVATNGFAAQLLDLPEVVPARAQVLITTPIAGLKIKGTFHFDQGYYYFRNIHKRILFGGGRNLDFEKERTSSQGLNTVIQSRLEHLLKEMILPGVKYEIQNRWSGIMGVGLEKKPVIRSVKKNVLAAVRMGGMGIAIGSWVGEKAAQELS